MPEFFELPRDYFEQANEMKYLNSSLRGAKGDSFQRN